MEKIKKIATNGITALIVVSLPVFTICASWIILHRVAEITMELWGQLDLVVAMIAGAALLLVWLNTLILDATIWLWTQLEDKN